MRESIVRQKRRLKVPLIAGLVLALVLAACGGAADEAAAPPSDAPSSPDPAPADQPADAEDQGGGYYEGKVLTIIVPFGAGGGTSLQALFMAPFLQRHIPGNPRVVVEHMPGANTLVGANYFESVRGERDDVIFYSGSSSQFNYAFEHPDANYDLTDYEALLAVPQGFALYAHVDTGVTGPENIMDPPVELIYPGVTPQGSELARLIAIHEIGLPIRVVMGYESTAAGSLAFEQGEVNVDGQGATLFYEALEQGVAVPIFAVGMLDDDGNIVRDPAFPDVPSTAELYEIIHGQPAEGPGWDAIKLLIGTLIDPNKYMFMHAELPQQAKDELAQAFVDMLADPEFQAEGEAFMGPYDLDVLEAAERRLETTLATITPEAKQYIIDFVRDEYGEDLAL